MYKFRFQRLRPQLRLTPANRPIDQVTAAAAALAASEIANVCGPWFSSQRAREIQHRHWAGASNSHS